jgi:uncharacterized protein (DUF885 family)
MLFLPRGARVSALLTIAAACQLLMTGPRGVAQESRPSSSPDEQAHGRQAVSPGAETRSSDAAAELLTLFREDWEWRLENYPEFATYLGDDRYNDRLTDESFEAIERRKEHERRMLERIRRIDRSQLSGQDVLSYDLFLRDMLFNVEEQRFPAELMPLTQMNGVQLDFPQLVAASPFRNVKDYENYLKRLRGFPLYVRQTVALMERGLQEGWTPPAGPLSSVPAQIRGQIVADPTKSPLYKPFESFAQGIPGAEQRRLSSAGKELIRDAVVPALEALANFIEGRYLPGARKGIAATELPKGKAYYALRVRRSTTTDLLPAEIHELGKREVSRIRKEMEDVVRDSGFQGSFDEFLTFLRTDPRFYFTEAQALVTAYRDIAKRADARLPELFVELPRQPYGVREIPAYEAPAQTTAYYQPGAADGSRAGYFWVNTYKLETRPRYEMEALSLHEAVPGHHLQVSRAQELEDLPDFRRNAGYTAYVEGWALYAERLGEEMGFYEDPYSKFGQLTYEMWRALRLVVDTGMHAFGWTRQQAIDLMRENAAKTENDIVVEIDRYIVLPGQALAYKVGELRIRALRERAERELGEGFDVRRFHNALLDDGALPLSLLEKRIDEWIAAEKGRPDSPA